MNRNDLREVIARAICRVQLNGGDPDQPAVRWNGTEMEPQSFPARRDYMDEAEHALSALDAAGLQVVPKEPTPKMCESYYELCRKEETLAVSASEVYRAMLAAREG